ncbi:endo alpha-1,4 polygalactosaminidase [Paenibacillus sp.]|uniref:endo alpha-1,4 polygalactosaminidase n=1 Tax=Paenibacillus sp. TaxID=58172 RepID=UPI0028126005|nr:endo alpha-1,4 polygalactosaminidase [Paenibacillus sp.]
MTPGWFDRWRGKAAEDERKFMIYYGHMDDEKTEALSRFDLVVVEPLHWTADRVDRLKRTGTKVIGYLSVMEWAAWNVPRGDALRTADYYRPAGEKLHLPQWDAYLMDIREKHYQNVLFDELEQRIVAKGMDGAFLDTVGDIEERVESPVDRAEMMHAYLAWLSELRARHPALWTMQNRGFELIGNASRDVDAFLWEDWRAEWAADPWGKRQLAMLQSLRENGLELFAVSGRPGAEGDRKAAKRQGMTYLSRHDEYSIWVEAHLE